MVTTPKDPRSCLGSRACVPTKHRIRELRRPHALRLEASNLAKVVAHSWAALKRVIQLLRQKSEGSFVDVE